MTKSCLDRAQIRGISTCVPEKVVDNRELTDVFSEQELRKVIGMVGIKSRHVSDGQQCSTDLCLKAAQDLLNRLSWEASTIDGLIMVTQSPDYLLPSSSCLVHRDLELSENCATFDVGLGCSGYPYGMWLAHLLVKSGQCRRVLLLHGETPSLFANPTDRSTALLFGDAGSATAIESSPNTEDKWYYNLKTDGYGYEALIIPAGAFRNRHCDEPEKYYVHMDGPQLFTFTTQKVPILIQETLEHAGISQNDIDHYVFHQANRFITQHIAKKMKIDGNKVPSTIENYGNTGGVSVPLTITLGIGQVEKDRARIMALGYGVGLSWGSVLFTLEPDTIICHSELKSTKAVRNV